MTRSYKSTTFYFLKSGIRLRNLFFLIIIFSVFPNNAYAELDSLGMPILRGWGKIDEGDQVYYINPKLYQLKVRGEYGRYLMREQLIRWYENPKAGRAPTSIGSYSTNCVEGYGSINCTTTPPIMIPGSPGSPGGVKQTKWYLVVDCLDMTYKAYGKFKNIKPRPKRWEKIGPNSSKVSNLLAKNCYRIESLPKSTYPNI